MRDTGYRRTRIGVTPIRFACAMMAVANKGVFPEDTSGSSGLPLAPG